MNTFPNGHPQMRRWEEIVDRRPSFAKFYPRKYKTPDGYMSTKVNAAIMGCVDEHKFEAEKTEHQMTISGIATTCAHIHGDNYFWIKKDIGAALLQTKMPEGMLHETPWPFHGFVLMLPWGMFPSGDGGYVGIINVGIVGLKLDADPVPLPHLKGLPEAKMKTGSPIIGGNDAMFIYAATVKPDGELTDWYSHVNLQATPEEAFADQLWVQGHMEPERQDPNRPIPGTKMIQDLARLVVNACHLMAARPEHVEASTPGPVKKPRSQEPTWWEPRWVGRRYVTQREVPAVKGSHASPRLHWRRGHWRQQAHGPGRKEHKQVWIEPCLINAANSTPC